MGPKLLGGAASLLAVVFILALPTIFKGEPADEVEPIEFGPPPVASLADAVPASPPSPSPPEPDLPAAAPGPPAPAPLVASGGGGGTAAEARQDPFGARPGDDETTGDDGGGDLSESEHEEMGEGDDASEDGDGSEADD